MDIHAKHPRTNTLTPALQNDKILGIFGAKMTSQPKIVKKEEESLVS